MKIITDQPQAKRKTIQFLLTTASLVVTEAPYFSVPLTDEDVATLDPDDADRELRAGELFFASGLHFTNTSTSLSRTLRVEVIGEGGSPITRLASEVLIPANETLTLAPGLSLFKRDLGNPSADGMRLRVRASGTGVQMTASLVEREAIDHSPDTEGL